MAHTTVSPVALVALSPPTQVGIPASSSQGDQGHGDFRKQVTFHNGLRPSQYVPVRWGTPGPLRYFPAQLLHRSNGPSTQRLLHPAVLFCFLSCGPIRDTEAIAKGLRFGTRRRRSRKAVRPPRLGRSPRTPGRRVLKMAPAKGWSRTVGSARSFVGNALGGVRGWSNAASWAVAGTLAYYLWVRPARQLKKEQEERAALTAASDPYRYVEKRKPIPDPQDTGLTYGKKKDPTKSEN